MKHSSNRVAIGASRRSFLFQASGLAALAARPALSRPREGTRERLARVLARYGSEIGDLRRVEERE
jgi:hypothetical protein